MMDDQICRRYEIRGRVQGVGFRAFTRRRAAQNGVKGWVRNRADGSVESLAVGSREGIAAFERAVRTGPAGSRVDSVEAFESVAEAVTSDSFDIVF